jgi:hypothetical protein
MVESLHPSVLPTRGGVVQIRGHHLAGARLSVDENIVHRTHALPMTGMVSIEVLEALEEDRILVEVGPGVGAQVWLLLENAYGKTRFSYAYEGKTFRKRRIFGIGNMSSKGRRKIPEEQSIFNELTLSRVGECTRFGRVRSAEGSLLWDLL